MKTMNVHSTVRAAVHGGVRKVAHYYDRTADELDRLVQNARLTRRPSARRGGLARLPATLKTSGLVCKVVGAILVDMLKPAKREHKLPRRWQGARARA